jgi:nitrite reductase/ring-hydroxylating ferredoxin subunit
MTRWLSRLALEVFRRATSMWRADSARRPVAGSTWLRAGTTRELERDRRIRFATGPGEGEADAVVVIATRRGPIAFVDRCPHMGRTLFDADLRGERLRCHGHGREYRLSDGARTVGRRTGPGLTLLPVDVSGDEIFVAVPRAT